MFYSRSSRIATALALLFLSLCVISCHDKWLPTDPKTATEVLESSFLHEVARRKIKPNYREFEGMLKEHMETTNPLAGEASIKCRLQWVQQLVENPSFGIRSVEKFTSELYESAKGPDGLRIILRSIAEKLDAAEKESTNQTPGVPVQLNPLGILVKSLHDANESIRKAFEPLTYEEQFSLREMLYQQTTGGVETGYLFADTNQARSVADLFEKVDRRQLIAAANALIGLADKKFLEQLGDGIRSQRVTEMRGVEGRIIGKIETPDGLIIVGGADSNVYHLDELNDVSVVIDIGGNDHYLEGSLNEKRQVLIILDLSGDDTYEGQTPGIQGGAIMGASLLVDERGDDTYISNDVAQGSTLIGVGILVDEAGNDTYKGDKRVQGQAIDGCGILLDLKGDDHYRAALLSQAVGGPLGFGLLMDFEGRDQYFAGGKYFNSYHDTPGFESWSQGIGVGAKDVAAGGIGLLMDGSGNDFYQADYFSHGGGYWFGAGIARDFNGDDQRIGATTENFDGSPRVESRYLRWGIGFGCHSAAGYVFDDNGNDLYQGDWASIAYSWDFAVAALCDFHGNDRYISSGSGVSQARNVSISFLYDVSGDDFYSSKGLGDAEETRKTGIGSSFTILLDTDGNDMFTSNLRNNTNAKRGWKGGIFIDQ
jgi:hypothetical protein